MTEHPDLPAASLFDPRRSLPARLVGIGAIAAAVAMISTYSLDRATRDGSLQSFAARHGGRDINGTLASLPRPTNGKPVVGIRYGNVDYVPTASIPAGQQKIKNVIGDPALGMPQ